MPFQPQPTDSAWLRRRKTGARKAAELVRLAIAEGDAEAAGQHTIDLVWHATRVDDLAE